MSITQDDTPDTAPTTLALDPREAFLHWEATTRDCIDFKRVYVRIAGGDHVAGTLLSQLAFWNLPSNRGEIHRLSVEREGKFWLVKKRTDWYQECAVGPRQYDRASKLLIDLGLITKKRFRFHGSPTTHLHLNVEALLAAVQAVESPGRSPVPTEGIPISPHGELEFTKSVNSLRPQILPKREKSKPLPLLLPLCESEAETPRTGFQLDEDRKTETTDPAPPLLTDDQIPVCAIPDECAAPDVCPIEGEPDEPAAALPDVPMTVEACEALYHKLPVDQQAALREEAIARLIKKGYHPDFLGMLVLTEIGHLLATQIGGCIAPVPLASAVRSAPSPAIERPTRPPEKPQAPLPAPTRSHLLLEDLQDVGRLLVIYSHAIGRGEVGLSEAERLKFCAAAKHALRCGENPPALFADNLKHQRWQYDHGDEDTARRQLQNHLYGCGAPRSSPPVPASAPPPLSKDAWMVREAQRELVRHGIQDGTVWAYLRHEHHWTQERCDTIAHELSAYQQACQQGAALGRLGGARGKEEEWQAAPLHPDVECPECGSVGGACACLDAEDV